MGLGFGLSVGFDVGVGLSVGLPVSFGSPISATHHVATLASPPAAAESAEKAALSRDEPWAAWSVAWKARHSPS